MAALTFDGFWRDHGVKQGLAGIAQGADKAHSSFARLASAGGKGLSSLDRAATRTNSAFGRFAGVAGKGVLGVAGAVTKFGVAGVAAFTAAAGAAVAYGIKTAAANENASIAFTTMLGSATKARRFLGELQQFAAKTPFEFPELQTAASSLISVGINADKVIPIMTTLGNITSGMGTGAEGVRRATVALQQMSAAGKISAEDLNQLRDAGVPLNLLFEGMSQRLGVSTDKLFAMREKGELGRKELEALMDTLQSGRGFERFDGLMDKQSESIVGLWSTIKDTFGQSMAQAVKPGIGALKDGMGGVSDALQRFSDWTKANKKPLGTVFEVAGETVKTFARLAEAAFGTFVSAVGGGDTSFADFADNMATNQEAITGGIFDMAESMTAFAEVAQVSFSAVSILAGSLAKAVGTLFATITIPLQKFFEIAAQTPFAPKWVSATATGLNAFNNNVLGAMQDAGQSSIDFGRTLDEKVGGAINATQDRIKELRDQEVFRAAQRDAAVRMGRAIDAVGNSGKLSKRELEGFNRESLTGTTRQLRLKNRLDDARDAFLAQYKASDKSKQGQEAF